MLKMGFGGEGRPLACTPDEISESERQKLIEMVEGSIKRRNFQPEGPRFSALVALHNFMKKTSQATSDASCKDDGKLRAADSELAGIEPLSSARSVFCVVQKVCVIGAKTDKAKYLNYHGEITKVKNETPSKPGIVVLKMLDGPMKGQKYERPMDCVADLETADGTSLKPAPQLAPLPRAGTQSPEKDEHGKAGEPDGKQARVCNGPDADAQISSVFGDLSTDDL